jgi:hypothetical protein
MFYRENLATLHTTQSVHFRISLNHITNATSCFTTDLSDMIAVFLTGSTKAKCIQSFCRISLNHRRNATACFRSWTYFFPLRDSTDSRKIGFDIETFCQSRKSLRDRLQICRLLGHGDAQLMNWGLGPLWTLQKWLFDGGMNTGGVARWFLFKPKIPIWVNFGEVWNGKCLYILWPFGIFYRHLGYFMTIWYILCSFGTFFPVLVSCTDENLATLMNTFFLRCQAYLVYLLCALSGSKLKVSLPTTTLIRYSMHCPSWKSS